MMTGEWAAWEDEHGVTCDERGVPCDKHGVTCDVHGVTCDEHGVKFYERSQMQLTLGCSANTIIYQFRHACTLPRDFWFVSNLIVNMLIQTCSFHSSDIEHHRHQFLAHRT